MYAEQAERDGRSSDSKGKGVGALPRIIPMAVREHAVTPIPVHSSMPRAPLGHRNTGPRPSEHRDPLFVLEVQTQVL